MVSLIDRLKEDIQNNVKECDTLSESMIWEKHDVYIWKAKQFKGTPHFYPVYKYKDYYSYSILALILKKGSFVLNKKNVKQLNKKTFLHLSGNGTIDKEITRIGQAHKSNRIIKDVNNYADLIASALIKDASHIEKINGDKKNIILCGGKDSLNLLLIPWNTKPIVASAEPNYENTCQFVEENNLNLEVINLEDSYDKENLDFEILSNCCRANMAHWRWGNHLIKIAAQYDNNVVFWKGQVADLYMTEKWKEYSHKRSIYKRLFNKIYPKVSTSLSDNLKYKIGSLMQNRIIDDTWNKSAVQQGCHNGFIREITNSLVISAYHGPEMMRVFEEVDLAAVAQKDMRHLVGERLLKRNVIYPQTNPSPPESQFRKGLHSIENFISLLKENSINVII